MNLEYLIRTMKWTNPNTGIKIELGKHLRDDIFINDSLTDFPEESMQLLIGPNSPDIIAKRFGSKVYYHEKNNLKLAVKEFNRRKEAGIEQFRCMRKLKELGIETPEVYATTHNVLVMDYIQYPNLENYISGLSASKQIVLRRKWIVFTQQLMQLVEGETIDTYIGNGYLVSEKPELKFGVYDQG